MPRQSIKLFLKIKTGGHLFVMKEVNVLETLRQASLREVGQLFQDEMRVSSRRALSA
jgi:hypothetical protein